MPGLLLIVRVFFPNSGRHVLVFRIRIELNCSLCMRKAFLVILEPFRRFLPVSETGLDESLINVLGERNKAKFYRTLTHVTFNVLLACIPM